MTFAELAAMIPLRFERYQTKLYARTPGGEIAYGDSCGLYEWRDGRRIHYSGGDQQASSRNGFHRHSDLPDEPFQRGLDAILSRVRLN